MGYEFKQGVCSFEGCGRDAVCHEMCDKHYRRVLKHGDVNHVRPDLKPQPRPCVICGKIFTPPKRHGATHCSKSCTAKEPHNIVRCSVMGKEYATEIGIALRDRGEGKTYRKYMNRHEHRVVAESILGRPLVKGEVIHHKDGKKRNNSPDNISITTQGQHMKEHGLGIPGMKLWWKPWEKRRLKCTNLNQELEKRLDS